jgi:hypothetical protein
MGAEVEDLLSGAGLSVLLRGVDHRDDRGAMVALLVN